MLEHPAHLPLVAVEKNVKQTAASVHGRVSCDELLLGEHGLDLVSMPGSEITQQGGWARLRRLPRQDCIYCSQCVSECVTRVTGLRCGADECSIKDVASPLGSGDRCP